MQYILLSLLYLSFKLCNIYYCPPFIYVSAKWSRFHQEIYSTIMSTESLLIIYICIQNLPFWIFVAVVLFCASVYYCCCYYYCCYYCCCCCCYYYYYYYYCVLLTVCICVACSLLWVWCKCSLRDVFRRDLPWSPKQFKLCFSYSAHDLSQLLSRYVCMCACILVRRCLIGFALKTRTILLLVIPRAFAVASHCVLLCGTMHRAEQCVRFSLSFCVCVCLQVLVSSLCMYICSTP